MFEAWLMLKLILALCALVGAACACAVTARAECDATGMVCETSASEGDCAAGDGNSSGRTEATVTVVMVWGTSSCSRTAGYGYWDNSIGVSVLDVGASWNGFGYDDAENGHFEGCFLFVGPLYQSCPGQLAPPEPGWGRVLP